MLYKKYLLRFLKSIKSDSLNKYNKIFSLSSSPLLQKYILFLLFFICFPVFQNLNTFSQQLSSDTNKFLGAGTSVDFFRDFNKYWNQLTPGNDGKWGSVTYARGQYNWNNLDKLYNYAINRGLLYKHHTLVWGSQQPSWIAGLDSANQRAEVENWFRLVGEKYPKMSFVDVVNEPFHTPLPSYKNALGGDGATGWDWVITSFQLARKYMAPTVKLILNEYNVLGNGTVTNNYISLINLLKDRNLIDGIGVQGHYFEFRGEIGGPNPYVYNISEIKNNLNKLTATGLPVYITEFDIDEAIDSNQLAQYKIYFPILWSNPGVKGITFWGYIEYDIWTSHPYTYLLLANETTERPALKWLRNYVLTPFPPILISPIAVDSVRRNPILKWYTSNNAKSYRFQISRSSSFSTTILDTIVSDTTVQVNSLAANTNHYWRVSATNDYGTSEYSTLAAFTTGTQFVNVKDFVSIPTEFQLSQNFPNPFNPFTTIHYSIPHSGYISLKVYNLLGQEIATLFEGTRQPGNYRESFDGSKLTSGVYLYQLRTNSFCDTKKFVLIK
jgi:GH35 family endo-1,4-beta-xylanase